MAAEATTAARQGVQTCAISKRIEYREKITEL